MPKDIEWKTRGNMYRAECATAWGLTVLAVHVRPGFPYLGTIQGEEIMEGASIAALKVDLIKSWRAGMIKDGFPESLLPRR